MSAPTYALLYQSRATRGLDASGLRAILETAVVRNEALDVTGLLLYGEMANFPGIPGLFVQWLEGPEAAVRSLYERICADPRHVDVVTVAEGPAEAFTGTDGRLFPAWAMAVKRLSDVPATLHGFLEYARQTSPSVASRSA
jgi:hypothetical protein